MSDSALPSPRLRKGMRSAPVGVIDVGSSKVCCAIARQDAEGVLRVLGFGHQASFGLRSGVVTNMDAAESAIGAAVQSAEKMAGETLRSVYVSLSGGQLSSATIDVRVGTGGQEIGTPVLRKVAQQCKAALGELEGDPVHIIPTGYALDGARGIKDPTGMIGDQLDVQINAVTANAAARRNLVTCIERCHLDVERVVVSPLAAARSCLSADELELGATLIDLGGGTTSIGVFRDGEMVFADSIPIGGIHVTSDIARGLITPAAHAERIKTLYGHAVSITTDRHEQIDVPQMGEDERTTVTQVPRSLMIGIIQPRLEEIFEMVRARLEHSGFDQAGGRRVVLTGGASRMQGTRELAQTILDKQVRLAKTPSSGIVLPDNLTGPEFSVLTGLLFYATQPNTEYRVVNPSEGTRGVFGRIGDWFRENISA